MTQDRAALVSRGDSTAAPVRAPLSTGGVPTATLCPSAAEALVSGGGGGTGTGPVCPDAPRGGVGRKAAALALSPPGGRPCPRGAPLTPG